MRPPVRRVLFVLHEPAYFRLYGSSIVEMGRRGWDVAIAFDHPHKRGNELLVPAGSGSNVRSLGALPGGVPASAMTLRAGLDYLRYLEPSYAHAEYLRRRDERRLPPGLRFLTRITRLPRWAITGAIRAGRLAERLIPVDRETRNFVRTVRPDVIVVSPVVIVGSSGIRQTEVIKAGQEEGIPVIVGVASWDHLTSKGLIRIVPDAVTVWNETQAREAEFLHRIPRRRIQVTGAQPLDHWFEPGDSNAVRDFRRTLGVDGDRHLILFTGSSRKMAPDDSEEKFVRRWLAALRGSTSANLRSAFVLVRPHPSNLRQWQDVELGDRNAAVYPRSYTGMPLNDEEVETFRRSMLSSSAVVGINTTAMIEAAILRRPVLSVRDPAFAHSQRETLHFAYLIGADGFVAAADSMADHLAQLEAALKANGEVPAASDRFIERFVRPRGAATPATTHVCDVIERVAANRASRLGADMPAPSEHVAIARDR